MEPTLNENEVRFNVTQVIIILIVYVSSFRKFFLISLLISTVSCYGTYTASCTFSMTEFHWAKQYSCSVGVEFLPSETYPIIEMISAESAHNSDFDDDNVQALSFTGLSMPYLPFELQKLFINLKTIRVFGSGLKFIQRGNFYRMSSLTALDLEGNAIETVPKDTFWDLAELEWLSLGDNKIRHFDPHLFNNMRSLNRLSFSTNLLESLDDNQFADNPEIHTIAAYDNQLKYYKRAINNLKKLKVSTFQNNPLLE